MSAKCLCRRLGKSIGPATLLIFLAIAGLVCGCSLLPSRSRQDKAEVKELQPKNQKAGSISQAALRSEVMRFADDYASTVAQAADDFAAASTNLEARVAALKWKLEQANAAYIDAANRNPILNSLDMVVLATLSRMVIESLCSDQSPSGPAAALLETHRRLETNAWRLVSGVLKEEQKAELVTIMREWREKNPNQRYVGGIRFREFAIRAQMPEQKKSKPTSVFNLLFIDPMAGLDPTARAIEETRQSAERMTYYAQRAPILLSWQAELLAYQLAEQPAPRQVLADADRLSKSAETFARLADEVPQLVDRQREAAIKQIFEGIAAERTNLLASLASEEEKVRGLLGETRATLESADRMATSSDHAIQSLHAFVRFVTPTNATTPTINTNKRPFDILDYGKAAAQIGSMAGDVNTLLTSVNQSLPQVKVLGQQAKADAQSIVDRAFQKGLILILVLLIGSVVAGLTYRSLAARLAKGLEPATPRPQDQLQIH